MPFCIVSGNEFSGERGLHAEGCVGTWNTLRRHPEGRHRRDVKSAILRKPSGGDKRTHHMRIAQIAPLTEAIRPPYGGTERVISWLTEELVALGHDVTLFASGDSQHLGEAGGGVAAGAAPRRRGARRQRAAHEHAGAGLPARRRSSTSCTAISTTTRSRCFPGSRRRSSPPARPARSARAPDACSTTFAIAPLVSISDAQRRPVPHAGWVRTVHHGLPARLLMPQPVKPDIFRVSRPHITREGDRPGDPHRRSVRRAAEDRRQGGQGRPRIFRGRDSAAAGLSRDVEYHRRDRRCREIGRS